MELSWKEQPVDGKVNVTALARPKSGDVWALGHTRRLFGASTIFLHRHGGGWARVFAINGRLDSISTLGDGSVLAVGDELSVLFDGSRWSTIESGIKRSRRIWGARVSSANAVADEGLFHFDGREWSRLDLKAHGIPGDWADGDCDSGGAGWIVGTNGTHSCMAAGSGSTWRPDSSGSWYLSLVYVADGSPAFAAGGDGLWRHDGGQWVGDSHHRDVSRHPLALSVVESTPIVVTFKLRDLMPPRSGRMAGAELEVLEVLTAVGWQTIRPPITLDLDHMVGLEVDRDARILIPRGSSVWESSPLPSSQAPFLLLDETR